MCMYTYIYTRTHVYIFSILNKATADLKKHSKGYM